MGFAKGGGALMVHGASAVQTLSLGVTLCPLVRSGRDAPVPPGGGGRKCISAASGLPNGGGRWGDRRRWDQGKAFGDR